LPAIADETAATSCDRHAISPYVGSPRVVHQAPQRDRSPGLAAQPEPMTRQRHFTSDTPSLGRPGPRSVAVQGVGRTAADFSSSRRATSCAAAVVDVDHIARVVVEDEDGRGGMTIHQGFCFERHLPKRAGRDHQVPSNAVQTCEPLSGSVCIVGQLYPDIILESTNTSGFA
jgi:hypothetical protein